MSWDSWMVEGGKNSVELWEGSLVLEMVVDLGVGSCKVSWVVERMVNNYCWMVVGRRNCK